LSWNTVVPGGKPTDGSWLDVTGGLSNGGCNGAGGGWVCIQWSSGNQILVGGVYEWVFDVTVKKGSLLDVGSIKANFDPPNGLILSENIAVAVPEGGAAELMLMLGGLSLFLFWRRNAPLSEKN
jgi:hypothetical protein